MGVDACIYLKTRNGEEPTLRDEYGEWVPALWQTEYRSWCSAMFSGIPDSEMMVGDKMEPPNVAVSSGDAVKPEQTEGGRSPSA